ncbi:MAG: hypothetical protein R6V04_04490 [bacterium]
MVVQPDFKELLELLNAHKVKYIGLNEFINNKRTTGRKKDLSDLEALGED